MTLLFTAVVLAAVAIYFIYFIRKRGLQHADRINRYFLGAVAAWLVCGDQAARMAAAAATKVADPEQRGSMVEALERSADVLVEHSILDKREAAEHVRGFTAEVSAQDWAISDLIGVKRALAQADAEYARALDQADPDVFVRRWPRLAS